MSNRLHVVTDADVAELKNFGRECAILGIKKYRKDEILGSAIGFGIVLLMIGGYFTYVKIRERKAKKAEEVTISED